MDLGKLQKLKLNQTSLHRNGTIIRTCWLYNTKAWFRNDKPYRGGGLPTTESEYETIWLNENGEEARYDELPAYYDVHGMVVWTSGGVRVRSDSSYDNPYI